MFGLRQCHSKNSSNLHPQWDEADLCPLVEQFPGGALQYVRPFCASDRLVVERAAAAEERQVQLHPARPHALVAAVYKVGALQVETGASGHGNARLKQTTQLSQEGSEMNVMWCNIIKFSD